MVGEYKDKTAKEYNKDYYHQNKDLINAKAKDYYNKNKDKLLQKITCLNCKGSYCLASMSNHFRTDKHLKSLQSSLEEELRKFEMEETNNIDNLLNGNI